MNMLVVLIGALTRFSATAHAAGEINGPRWAIERGQPNPAVEGMWNKICSTLPFCDTAGPQAFVTFTQKLITFVLSTIGVAAVSVLIYAAIKIIMSQGNDDGITEAKKIAMWALGGVILAILGNTIVLYFSQTVIPEAIG